MKELKYWLVCLSLCLTVETGIAQCTIEINYLQTSNIYLSYKYGIYGVHQSDIVPVGQKVYLLCYGATSLPEFECKSDFQNQIHVFDPPLNTARCSTPFEASVVHLPDTSCPVPYVMHAVGYQFNGLFLELYRNCFDRDHLAFQHSIYKAYRFKHTASRPNPSWNSDQIGPFDIAYLGSTVRACFLTNLGAEQPQCSFDRGHMTPASAFIFKELKSATFRYLNAVPQYSKVNRGNWKRIETWVNNLVMGNYDYYETYDELQVCTGTIGVHELKHNNYNNMIPIYLLDNNKIPVPKWIYKIVRHISGNRWVMLTYNDVIPPREREINHICTQIWCHEDLQLNNNGVGHTVCCEPYDFIERNLRHLRNVC
ncbi:uncharacterized protein [Drosophila takahashii]|uniref:uncharacterized protein n=1 Tax=Drosophila takahashii TaxID=29030 RepID=UPI001CF8C1BE|nr:uncharacterized protein LOC108060197 [Drosophila takahashii]